MQDQPVIAHIDEFPFIAPSEADVPAANIELIQDIENFDKEIKVLEDQSLVETASSIRDTINAIDESLTAMDEGARQTIEEITNAHLDEAATENGATLTQNELVQLTAAQNIRGIVKEVRTQSSLILFAAQNRVPLPISETVNLVEKEFEKFRHTARMYKLKGFTYDSVFNILRKHRTPKTRKVTSFLFYFFKYLNSMKVNNIFAQNVNYARFTSTLISTSLLAGVTLETNELLYKAITQQ